MIDRQPSLVVLLLGLMIAVPACAEGLVLDVTVRGVEDGDTFAVIDQLNGYYRIDIQDIDAPEKAQPYGVRAKSYLTSLILGKQVSLHIDIDRFNANRAIEARVFLADNRKSLAPINVAHLMVSSGHAWLGEKKVVDAELASMLNIAKLESKGLWSLPTFQIVKPTEWYRRASTEKGYTRTLKLHPVTACELKDRCVQMNNCNEAYYFMKHCALKSLDTDGDGIPCPDVCRGKYTGLD